MSLFLQRQGSHRTDDFDRHGGVLLDVPPNVCSNPNYLPDTVLQLLDHAGAAAVAGPLLLRINVWQKIEV